MFWKLFGPTVRKQARKGFWPISASQIFLGTLFVNDFLGIFWNSLEILWEFFGNSLGIFWEFFGNSLGIFWKFFGNFLGIFWEFFGNFLGILWEFFGNSLGILCKWEKLTKIRWQQKSYGILQWFWGLMADKDKEKSC